MCGNSRRIVREFSKRRWESALLRISTDAAFSIRPSSKSSIHTFIHNSSMITATALSTTSLHSAAGYMAPFHNACNAET